MSETPNAADQSSLALTHESAPTWWAQARFAAADIKLAHSVFALPFALMGMMLAAGAQGRWPSIVEVLLIVLCMVFARTFAMLVNRWADRKIDADNPRTKSRALPAGRVRPTAAVVFIAANALFFLATCAGFYLLRDNPWPLTLAFPVLLWLAGYSYAKRFTWLCHVMLGSALAISPVAAALAINPAYVAQPAVWLLAGMVTCWVAGFDIIYALQDVEVDRRQGNWSVPSRLGVEPGLWISRMLHLAAVGFLLTATIIEPQLNLGMWVGFCVVVVLLLTEHLLIWRDRQRHLPLAFFTLNGIISVVLGLLGCVDVVLHLQA